MLWQALSMETFCIFIPGPILWDVRRKEGRPARGGGERNACPGTSYLGRRRGQEPSEHMAGLSLSYEECTALREAAERVPVGKRSEPLVSALRILCAVMAAVERGRDMMDQEDTPSPADSSS